MIQVWFPDVAFVDIEDNIEYIEREDEFDEDFKLESEEVEASDYTKDIDVFSRYNMFVLSDTDDEGTEPFHMVPWFTRHLYNTCFIRYKSHWLLFDMFEEYLTLKLFRSGKQDHHSVISL